jgi:hypothetical protein
VTLGPKALRVSVLIILSSFTLAAQSIPDARFHSLIPLGADAYELRGEQWKGVMTLLASAENNGFEGMERRKVEQRETLFANDGRQLEHYPGKIDFRVTASFRTRLPETSPFPIGAPGNQNGYLLHLKFRIVVFDGLRQTVVEPESVEMIGVPEEMPYDERIYRVSADLSRFPMRDRVVLEVHDPDGGRICKFHLDLM